jgi:AraC family transcriptional regulator
MQIVIANMVCKRCIMVVEKILQELAIPYHSIEIGKVDIESELNANQINKLDDKLKLVGFHIVSNRSEEIIQNIKARILLYLEEMHKRQDINLSSFITQKVFYDYSYLSDLFSQIEHKTIEQYFIDIRLDKVKELLKYDRMSIADIAYTLGFSSPQHLTNHFKQHIGQTPSAFRKAHKY